MNELKIAYQSEKLKQFCTRWHIQKLELFGSALSNDFQSDSDIDLLVDYAASYQRTLEDVMQMQDEIDVIFNRSVDLIPRSMIERSPNPYKRENILNNTVVLYG